MKNIINKNPKGQFHGYRELYFNIKLYIRGNYKNDKPIGYEEWHHFKDTNFYIK